MTSLTGKAHDAFDSIFAGPCERPEVVWSEMILLRWTRLPIPILIYVDEDRCYDETDQLGSDADTEIMATPEFWEAFIDKSATVPANEGEAVGSSPVHTPTRSPVCEDLKDLQNSEQSPAKCFHLGDKVLEVTEGLFNVLQDCSCLEAAGCEDVAHGQLESEQSPERGNVSQAEEPRGFNGVPEPPMTGDNISQESTDQTGTSVGKDLSCGFNDMRSTKRKLSHDEGIFSQLR